MNSIWSQLKYNILILTAYLLLIFIILDNIKPGLISNYYNLHWHLLFLIVWLSFYLLTTNVEYSQFNKILFFIILIIFLFLVVINFQWPLLILSILLILLIFGSFFYSNSKE